MYHIHTYMYDTHKYKKIIVPTSLSSPPSTTLSRSFRPPVSAMVKVAIHRKTSRPRSPPVNTTYSQKAHIHTHIHTYITYIHTYIHKYIHTQSRIPIEKYCNYNFFHLREYIHANIHTYMHTYIYTYIRTYLSIFRYAHSVESLSHIHHLNISPIHLTKIKGRMLA